MRKVLSFLLISLFLISFVSAGVITVEPNIFTLDAMPGEVINKTINITTAGNLAVYLNTTSEANITLILNRPTPLIVENNITIEVQFTIPTGIIPGSYDIYLTASTENIETITTITTPSGSSGSSSRTILLYVYPNGSTSRIRPTENITTNIIYLNNDDIEANLSVGIGTEAETETEAEVSMTTGEKVIMWIFIILLLSGAGFAFYKRNLIATEIEEVAYE